MATETYHSRIMKALSKLGHNGTANTDNSNTGSYLGEYYLWNTIRKFAEKREKNALTTIEDAKLYDVEGIAENPPGTYEAASSGQFFFSVTVTEKVRRFNKDKLVEIMTEGLKKHKVQPGIIRAWIEESYTADKPQLRKAITER